MPQIEAREAMCRRLGRWLWRWGEGARRARREARSGGEGGWKEGGEGVGGLLMLWGFYVSGWWGVCIPGEREGWEGVIWVDEGADVVRVGWRGKRRVGETWAGGGGDYVGMPMWWMR